MRLASAGLIAALLVGALGRYVPIGDSLAVFRLELAGLLVVSALVGMIAGTRRSGYVSLAVAAFAIGSVLSFSGVPDLQGPAHLRLHQHNVLFNNKDAARLARTIAGTDADVVTLQEVGGPNFTGLKSLGADFPIYHICQYDRGGTAVFVRGVEAAIDAGCAEGTELAWIRFDTLAGPVTVASVHLLWPWPKSQYWQLELVERELARLPQPVVLAGDFNMVPWSATLSRLSHQIDGKVARGITPSYVMGSGWPAFRIDNVIAPEGADLRVEVVERLGSDHNGLTAEIRFPQIVLPDGEQVASRP